MSTKKVALALYLVVRAILCIAELAFLVYLIEKSFAISLPILIGIDLSWNLFIGFLYMLIRLKKVQWRRVENLVYFLVAINWAYVPILFYFLAFSGFTVKIILVTSIFAIYSLSESIFIFFSCLRNCDEKKEWKDDSYLDSSDYQKIIQSADVKEKDSNFAYKLVIIVLLAIIIFLLVVSLNLKHQLQEQEQQIDQMDQNAKNNFTAIWNTINSIQSQLITADQNYNHSYTQIESNFTSITNSITEISTTQSLAINKTVNTFSIVQQQLNLIDSNVTQLHSSVTQLNSSIIDISTTQNQSISQIREAITSIPSFACTLPCENGGVPNSDCTYCIDCPAGWSGTYCNQTIYENCTIVCLHGGQPDVVNGTCTTCVDCQFGWTGYNCGTWNSSISTSDLEQFYNELLSKLTSPPNHTRSSSSSSHCANNLRIRGLGAVMNHRGEPIKSNPDGAFQLTYSDNIIYDYHGNSHCIADNVVGQRTSNAGGSISQAIGSALPSIFDFEKVALDQLVENPHFPPLPLEFSSPSNFVSQYLSATRLIDILLPVEVLELSLPAGTESASKGSINEPLTPVVYGFLKTLPPWDASVPNIVYAYTYFFENVAFKVVTKTTMGQYARIAYEVASSVCTKYNTDELVQAALMNFNSLIGVANPTNEFAYADFVSSIVNVIFSSEGGDALSDLYPSPSIWQQFMSSSGTNMVPIKYWLVGIDQLISDPDSRSNMQLAMNYFLSSTINEVQEQINQIQEIVSTNWLGPVNINMVGVVVSNCDFAAATNTLNQMSGYVSAGGTIQLDANANCPGYIAGPYYAFYCTRNSEGQVQASIVTLDTNGWCSGSFFYNTFAGPWVSNGCSSVGLPEYYTCNDPWGGHSITSAQVSCCFCEPYVDTLVGVVYC